jgi:uncharacterized membrane protein
VHIEASDPRAHVQALNDFKEWTTVCEVPCDRPLDARFDYRLAGEGLRPTGKFQVPPQGQLFLHADMKPTRNVVLGATLTGAGGLLLLTGGLELLLGALDRSIASTEQDANRAQAAQDRASLYTALGAVFSIVGVVVLIPGIVFLAKGTKSTLTMDDATALHPPKFRIVAGGFAF